MRQIFQDQMKELEIEMISTGGLLEQAIDAAVKALTEENFEKIQEVRHLEEAVDHAEKKIENLCLRLITLQQPVAGDMRRISAALKMITDMERIGDQAADIADLSQRLIDHGVYRHAKHLNQMAEVTSDMVSSAIDAYVNNDLELAKKVMRTDDVVDELFVNVKDDLIALIRQSDQQIESAVDLLMVAKYFERIGDHAVNIAEWVDYSINGDIESQK
jgi:phosphate transport system protein